MRVEEIPAGTHAAERGALMEKRLSARERSEPEAFLRLRAEAALLGRLDGRVTPRLVAHGEDELGPWLRTAKLPFPTLLARIEAAAPGPLDVAFVESATRAAFAALAELHDASDERGPLAIVHADISPANLVVDDVGAQAFFLDLELAAWRESPARDGAFRGTIAYAAPEIARGEHPTARSDLFSLAAALLHATTGNAPRSGPSLAALLAAAAEQPVLDAGHEALLASRGVGHAAIVACLALDPRRRPGSAREVAARLR